MRDLKEAEKGKGKTNASLVDSVPCQKLGRIDVWLGTERPTHSGTLPQESSNIRTHFCFTEPLGLEIEQGVVFEMLSVWQKKQLYIAAWQSRDRSKLARPTWTEDRSTCHPNPAKQSYFCQQMSTRMGCSTLCCYVML